MAPICSWKIAPNTTLLNHKGKRGFKPVHAKIPCLDSAEFSCIPQICQCIFGLRRLSRRYNGSLHLKTQKGVLIVTLAVLGRHGAMVLEQPFLYTGLRRCRHR